MRVIDAVSDKVICKPVKDNVSEGGIVIPDGAQQDPQDYATVLSVGGDVTSCKPGQTIVFHQQAGQTMLHDRQLLRVVKEEEIYGIIKEGE